MHLGNAAGTRSAQAVTTTARRRCLGTHTNVCLHSGNQALSSRNTGLGIITSRGSDHLTNSVLGCDKYHRIFGSRVSSGGTNPVLAGFIPSRASEEMRHEHEPLIADNFPLRRFCLSWLS